MRRQKATPINAITDGEIVKVVGDVVGGAGTLRSPLSRRVCIYYHLLLLGPDRTSVFTPGMTNLVDEGRGFDFVIHDGSGEALVRVDGATPILTRDRTGKSTFLLFQNRELRRLLAERDIEHPTTHREHYHAFEGVLEVGERVTVVGLARWEADPDSAPIGPYREAGRRLVFAAAGAVPLLFSDSPRKAEG